MYRHIPNQPECFERHCQFVAAVRDDLCLVDGYLNSHQSRSSSFGQSPIASKAEFASTFHLTNQQSATFPPGSRRSNLKFFEITNTILSYFPSFAFSCWCWYFLSSAFSIALVRVLEGETEVFSRSLTPITKTRKNENTKSQRTTPLVRSVGALTFRAAAPAPGAGCAVLSRRNCGRSWGGWGGRFIDRASREATA